MDKILYISSEAFPLVKTGGLGDVAGSLPPALLKLQQDIRILLPAYQIVLDNLTTKKVISQASYNNIKVSILETRLPGSKVKVWLVDCPMLFDRPGGPYTDQHNQPWSDNALRFAIFCYAAVDVALNKLTLNWLPTIVHCNDWQSGLVPALLSLYKKPPATIFTIHNLAYQGNFDYQTFVDLKLPPELWHIDRLEFYNQLSFIKGGIAFADKVTTVSPNYAQEIMLPEFGYGLDGLVKHRSDDVSGILNGIDEKYWNPGADNHLVQKYNKRSLSNKQLNKLALQKEFNLPISETIPMIGMVSRIVEQKGFELILQSLPELLEQPVQVVILGTGDSHYEIELLNWHSNYPDKIVVTIGYSEVLAHQIEAASDLYLMPSTFEPCGLNQLYSLQYGTLPIVTPVGGLADTVVHASEETITKKTANGFVLETATKQSLIDTVHYAEQLFSQKDIWKQLQLNAMTADHSWQASAVKYLELYKAAKKSLATK